MKAKHIIIMISSIFVLMFSMLLIVAILFSDEKNGGNSNIEYGGVNFDIAKTFCIMMMNQKLFWPYINKNLKCIII